MGQNRELSRFPNAITVLDNGNVGMGTTNPSQLLEVNVTTQDNGIRITSSNSKPTLRFYSTASNASNRNWAISPNGQNFGDLQICTSAAQNGDPTASDRLTRLIITSGGNVGIGTLSPEGLLHVGGSGASNVATPTAIVMDGTYRSATPAFDKLKFYLFKASTESYGFGLGGDGDVQYWAGSSSNGNHRFYTSQVERLRIAPNGNVGIGTSNPTTRLQIGSITGGGTGSSSPTCITMDETFGTNSIGSNFKLKIFQNTGSNAYGLGVSDSLFEIVSGTGGSIGMFTNQNQLAMRLSAGGVVTTPLQPAFTASNVGGSNVTGANVKLTGYSDVRTNIGNCYNGSTSRFTANTAGMYLFKAHAWLPPSTTIAALSIRVNGSQKAVHRMSHTGTQSNYCTLVPTLIWYLAVGDYVELYTSTDGGEVHLSTGETYSNFSGVFLG